MNTFTFTDDEVELLIKIIDSAKGIEAGSPFLAIKEKLERDSYVTKKELNDYYIESEVNRETCEHKDLKLIDTSDTIIKDGALFIDRKPKEK